MERLLLQLIKKKLTCLDKFPPLNYHKALNPLFFVLSLKFQKNLPHYLVPFKILLPIPLQRGGGRGGGGGGERKLWSIFSLINSDKYTHITHVINTDNTNKFT